MENTNAQRIGEINSALRQIRDVLAIWRDSPEPHPYTIEKLAEWDALLDERVALGWSPEGIRYGRENGKLSRSVVIFTNPGQL